MKPDGPGLWVSEEGHVAIAVTNRAYELSLRVVDSFGKEVLCPQSSTTIYLDELNEVLPGVRWQKAEVPRVEFPTRKPAMVYAETACHCPAWWMLENEYAVTFDRHVPAQGYTATIKRLKLIDHPDQPDNAEELLSQHAAQR